MQLHNEESKPVAYATRAMLYAETRYAQIEKELLCIMLACERFHQFECERFHQCRYGACVEDVLTINH